MNALHFIGDVARFLFLAWVILAGLRLLNLGEIRCRSYVLEVQILGFCLRYFWKDGKPLAWFDHFWTTRFGPRNNAARFGARWTRYNSGGWMLEIYVFWLRIAFTDLVLSFGRFPVSLIFHWFNQKNNDGNDRYRVLYIAYETKDASSGVRITKKSISVSLDHLALWAFETIRKLGKLTYCNENDYTGAGTREYALGSLVRAKCNMADSGCYQVGVYLKDWRLLAGFSG